MTIARQLNSKPAPKVLVADPDGDSRGVYAHVLGLQENEITHASDGREALVKVLEYPFALVITETDLPLIDGYSLCEVIRKDAAIRGVPIMVVTADARPVALRRALIAGADVVLSKPFANEVLSSQAKRLILGDVDRRRQAEPATTDAVPELKMAAVGTGKSRGIKSRSHKRYDTTQPPVAPPVLRCPSCDRSLTYEFSHIGGVSAREPEQWDYYACSGPCGQFRYRQRTRKLQHV
jgi:two-component system, OmpR family, phosphate regulon response regulator PhoB